LGHNPSIDPRQSPDDTEVQTPQPSVQLLVIRHESILKWCQEIGQDTCLS